MKVNFNQGQVHQTQEQAQPGERKGRVSVAANIKKESVLLDLNNNQIDLRTKQIIKRASQDE